MEILAKSEPRLTLVEHIEDCLRIWVLLKEAFPAVTKICNSNDFDFWETLRLAIIFHDLGKAHPEFQNVLKKLPDKWLKQRHELFSLPFIEAANMEENAKTLIKLVVAGHHKSYNGLQEFIKQYRSSKSKDFEWEEDLLDYQQEFKKINSPEIIGILKAKYQIEISNNISAAPEKIILSYLSKTKTGNLETADLSYFQLLLLFGALKHCDHLGSARIEKIETIDAIDFSYLNKKKEALEAEGKDFYEHQIKCSKAIGNIILTSPTGSGKTESAMLWLRRQIGESGQGRVFYILPFTASINAMFERLGDDENGLSNEKVGMIHGKLSDYLYEYLDDYQYDKQAKREQINALKDKFRTIYTPLKVTTPFQLLKHLFGLKGFEQGLFELTGGYLIFDEIHAYSPSVFAQIKVLLEFVTKHLHGKVFIMTATMPSFLKKEIENTISGYTAIQASQTLYDRFNRHKIVLKAGLLAENLQLIISDLSEGKKVLVVCNTVKQAQETYKVLRTYSRISVLLHSAFTGEDRMINEKTLKEGEKNDDLNSIQLLVGTQAIEVSLDIDYHVIYSEPAPFDALIQRFGRVNRKRRKGICPVVVFIESNSNDKYIYDRVIVTRTIEVFREIIKVDDSLIREEKLQYYIDLVYPDWIEKDRKIFNNAYDLLNNSIRYLYPMLHSKEKEEDFYKQFEGVKVLPIALKERFNQFLNERDFIGAERLKVQIRKNKFAQLLKENDEHIYQDKYTFETDKGKLVQIQYWVLEKKYDPELGLLYDEQETWSSNLIV